MQPVGARLINYLPPDPGTGQIADTGKVVESLDLARGLDSTLGKPAYLELGKKMQMYDKINGVFSVTASGGNLLGNIYA